MIPRTLHARLLAAARHYPIVTVTGPRQSGKTTLAREAFPDKPYVNLERPDTRAFASSDPHGFLAGYPDGAVLDEVQRVPELLSYLQVRVDERQRVGEFVLTGSQHFGLLSSISQSLAGRTAILHLLPLAWEELQHAAAPPADLFDALLSGSYPRIHDRGVPPGDWLGDYTATYVERDVRQVLAVGDLTSFQTFLRVAAGRVGQLLNLSGLGADCGISHPTAKAWLSVLETGYITHRLPPFHRNLGKRLIKSPKLYFYDSGLLCHLLGIRTVAELRGHPLRGSIFESWVIAEILKARLHRGLTPDLFFYRDFRGAEIDAVLVSGLRQVAVEIKSSQTFAPDFLQGLASFAATLRTQSRTRPRLDQLVMYGGEDTQRRGDVLVLPWKQVNTFDWAGAKGRARAKPDGSPPARG